MNTQVQNLDVNRYLKIKYYKRKIKAITFHAESNLQTVRQFKNGGNYIGITGYILKHEIR